MNRIVFVVVVGFFTLGSDCGAPAPTFTQLRSEVFEPRCGNAAGCHAENPARGLDLKVDPYAALLNATPVADPDQKYVVPGEPANSLLMTILTSGVDVGDDARDARQMPPGFALPQETLDGIEAWIAAGALNN